MLGLDTQIRQSDAQRNAQDLMFGEYGSDDTVVISGGGTLTQEMIEDAHVRSEMNLGNADMLLVDPKVLSRVQQDHPRQGARDPRGLPAGRDRRRPPSAVGQRRHREDRVEPVPLRQDPPRVPAQPPERAVDPGVLHRRGRGGQHRPRGGRVRVLRDRDQRDRRVAAPPGRDRLGHHHRRSAGHPDHRRHHRRPKAFNVYRSNAGGTEASARFIGRVIAASSGNTTFLDLGNKKPGFVTGLLIQSDTMTMKELAPYSRVKLAQTDLSTPEAHFRFVTLAVKQPRKNAIIDNLVGSF
jgi:hypothetical protein